MCLVTSIGVFGFHPNNKKKSVYLVEACLCVWMVKEHTQGEQVSQSVWCSLTSLQDDFQCSVGSLARPLVWEW